MVYEARRREVTTISGLGVWPRAATLEYFRDRAAGDMPDGLLRTVVPAAPDAWITALERFGTLGFAEVAQPAIELARDGFPLGPVRRRDHPGQNEDAYRRWPTSAPIYLPGGRPPRAGERFVQADLGRTLTYLADEDRAARRGGPGGRARGRARRLLPGRRRGRDRALPRGGGRAPHARGPRPTSGSASSRRCGARFGPREVLTCGFWCQGPVLPPDAPDPGRRSTSAALGHNSPDYVHTVTEAMKLAFADREAYYGDPRHVDVPGAGLLDPGLRGRRAAGSSTPPVPGPRCRPRATPGGRRRPPGVAPRRGRAPGSPAALGTSYVAVVDRDGQRVLGDAERRLDRHAGHPRHRARRLLARLPGLARSRACERRRAGQAAAAHAEPGPGPRRPAAT